ncbi:hypothetical protein NKI94_11340 [Mesorhizobium australicum]|uniref:YaaC family protein n=1 Tax=Mesorhizobium australicum TaxID=536018 RepID=UPI003339BAB7
MTERAIPASQRPNVKKQMEQLAYCLRQAYEFSQSARSSGLSTKALQAYYCITALANAEILWLGDGRVSIDARPAKFHRHGLSLIQAPSLDASAAAPDLDRDGKLTGLFGLWRSYSKHSPHYLKRDLETHGNLGQSKYDIGSTAMPLSSVAMPDRPISLIECLQHIPGMVTSLSSSPVKSKLVRGAVSDRIIYGENSDVVSVRKRTVIHPCHDDLLGPVLERFLYSSRLVEGISIVQVQSGAVFEIVLTKDVFDAGSSSPEIFPDTTENLYFLGDGDFLNEVGYFYTAMYILGMLSRYYPNIWMKEINRSSHMTVLCDEMIDKSLERAPLMVLSALEDRVFVYQ